MKTNYRITLIISLALLLLISCEKEISIDLNKSNPKYVIEGNVSIINGESKVKITQTLNFDQVIPYPTISDALVTITDNMLNIIDTLKTDTAESGTYTKPNFVGIEGHSYTMTVRIGAEIFSALSTMPYALYLDSLEQLNLADSIFNGRISPSEKPTSIIRILPHYKKTSNTDYYFQFGVAKNDSVLSDIIARNDLGKSGSTIPFPLFIRAAKTDTLIIDMQFIDKSAFEYLYGLSGNVGQFSATPSNPTSNISNGALGFFKAHTSQKKTMIIK